MHCLSLSVIECHRSDLLGSITCPNKCLRMPLLQGKSLDLGCTPSLEASAAVPCACDVYRRRYKASVRANQRQSFSGYVSIKETPAITVTRVVT